MSDELNISSEDIKYLSIPTLKKFVKHVLAVTKKQEDRRKAREALVEHIQKIKKEAKGNKTNKEKLNKHLAELENKVQDLLNKEAKMLRSQEYENKTLQELRKKINLLEQQIAIKEEENRNLMQMNREKIQAMQDSISSLRHHVGDYVQEKTARDRRLQQLENKIRAKVDYKKLDTPQEQIRRLEQKYVYLQQKGTTSQEVLEKIQERIQLLRQETNS